MSTGSRTRRPLYVIVALACAALGALIVAAPAAASETVTLFNCTGPGGTPTTLTVEKQSLNGSALHIVGTNETLNRQGELDLVTGQSFGPPPGLVSSGLMVTCEFVIPVNGDLGLLYGKIAQTSP